ncbi:MAG TPA: thiamine pyrophosphate-dependent enzyme [Stellaceae bacterium]|nr:thiamine pyrophosphate-dependent enzyme [Stellaceae bacterium]
MRYGGASAELLQLAERLQIPVGASVSGLGAIDCRHPLSLGLVSRGGLYQANGTMREADVLLALGVRFDDRTASSWIQGYSFTIPPTRLIHVDIDPDEIGRNYPVALGLMADARTFLRQLLAEIEARRAPRTTPARQAWLARIDVWRREWEAAVASGYRDEATPINPQRAAHEIDGALPPDAILVSNIGVHHNWLLQFCKPRRPDSLIGRMGFGPMGFGVAGVLGAKLAAPDRPCVSVCGDGAFFMHANVLGTAVEYDIPAVWVVGTIIPMPRSAVCSAAISGAASWRPISAIRRRASPITRILRRWRGPAALRACASTAPAISATRSRARSQAASPV